MGNKASIHQKALWKLASHPELIGVKKKEVLQVSVEPLLFSQGRFYVEPDLVFILRGKKLKGKRHSYLNALIIEYKSNGQKKLSEKGEGQLEKAVDFYQKIMKIPAEGRLITGDSYPTLRKNKINV